MDERKFEDTKTRDSLSAVIQNLSTRTSDNEMPDTNISQAQRDVENMVNNDLNVIRSLMGAGAITREQGHNLMKQVIQNAYTNVTTQNHDVKTPVPPEDKSGGIQDVFADFAVDKPDFFNGAGREDVLFYLKNSPVNFDKDELLQISKLIESVENGAVDRYLKKLEYGKTLNDENAIAKQRLTANAYSSYAPENNGVFTRAQIGKMSGEEFAKFEKSIMEQVRKGLIK